MDEAPELEESGSAAEIEALVTAHVDYARALAYKISKRLPPSVDVEELMGYARLGLAQAAKAYDPDMGVAFTTFSYYRIRGAVFDGLREMTWLPPESRKANVRSEAEDSLCEGGLGRVRLEADSEELARAFRDTVKALGAVFLLSEAGEEDQIEAIDEESAADAAERNDLVRSVREALGSLDEQQQTIVRLVYFEHQSMSDVARELGVNKSTVSRAHGKAVEVLRELLSG